MKNQLSKLENKKTTVFDPDFIKNRASIKDKIQEIEDFIDSVESGVDELTYFSKIGDVVNEYYEIFDSKKQITDEYNEDDQVEDTEKKTNENKLVSDKLVNLNKQSQKKRIIRKPTKKRNKINESVKNNNILSYIGKENSSIVTANRGNFI